MDFELGSGGPPFENLRDNQLNELQSNPSQSILANVIDPAVHDSDSNGIPGSESCHSIASVNVSNNNESELNSINPFAPGDFAKKRVFKLVEWFSGHSHAIKS